MRRGIGIAVLLLVILGGIAIGVSAYNAGVTHGLAQAAGGGQVVRVVGPGYGFFPFGLFLLVVNGLMLWLTSALSTALDLGFHVRGFWSAFFGALVVSIVSTLLSFLVRSEYSKRRVRTF